MGLASHANAAADHAAGVEAGGDAEIGGDEAASIEQDIDALAVRKHGSVMEQAPGIKGGRGSGGEGFEAILDGLHLGVDLPAFSQD